MERREELGKNCVEATKKLLTTPTVVGETEEASVVHQSLLLQASSLLF